MSLSTLIYNRNNGEMESGASPPQNDYGEILAAVQTYISKEHAQALADALTEDDAQAKVLGLIQKYIIDEKNERRGLGAAAAHRYVRILRARPLLARPGRGGNQRQPLR